VCLPAGAIGNNGRQRLIICDPHAGGDESLSNRIAALKARVAELEAQRVQESPAPKERIHDENNFT
jgi:hypothetical protein